MVWGCCLDEWRCVVVLCWVLEKAEGEGIKEMWVLWVDFDRYTL